MKFSGIMDEVERQKLVSEFLRKFRMVKYYENKDAEEFNVMLYSYWSNFYNVACREDTSLIFLKDLERCFKIYLNKVYNITINGLSDLIHQFFIKLLKLDNIYEDTCVMINNIVVKGNLLYSANEFPMMYDTWMCLSQLNEFYKIILNYYTLTLSLPDVSEQQEIIRLIGKGINGLNTEEAIFFTELQYIKVENPSLETFLTSCCYYHPDRKIQSTALLKEYNMYMSFQKDTIVNTNSTVFGRMMRSYNNLYPKYKSCGSNYYQRLTMKRGIVPRDNKEISDYVRRQETNAKRKETIKIRLNIDTSTYQFLADFGVKFKAVITPDRIYDPIQTLFEISKNSLFRFMHEIEIANKFYHLGSMSEDITLDKKISDFRIRLLTKFKVIYPDLTFFINSVGLENIQFLKLMQCSNEERPYYKIFLNIAVINLNKIMHMLADINLVMTLQYKINEFANHALTL